MAVNFSLKRPDPTSAEKAAILLATLDSTVAVNVLKKLDAEDVKALLETSAQIGPVTSEVIEPLVDEFARDVSTELGIMAGPQQLMALLESAYSADQISGMLGRPVKRPLEDVWKKLTPGMETTLVPYLLDQHEQVSAYVVSRLQPDLAAKCISMFPKGARNRIARRLLKISDVFPAASETVQRVLLEDLFATGSQSKAASGKGVLAAVINKLDRTQSMEVLEELAKSSPSDLAELRKLIFMFEDIPQMDLKNRMKFIDRVPAELIIASLFGMDDGFKAAILEAMSARTKRMVESELQGDTSQPNKDTMAARRKIADMAILMSQKGELDLPQPEDADAQKQSQPATPAAA
jgi:flagellar motor switch protein FliG